MQVEPAAVLGLQDQPGEEAARSKVVLAGTVSESESGSESWLPLLVAVRVKETWSPAWTGPEL
jgi:hypothetical protein